MKNTNEPKMKELTCYNCKEWIDCKRAFDPSNTNNCIILSK